MRLQPYYSTKLGRAYLGDALHVMERLPAQSVDPIVTSPPFPLTFRKKKPYTSGGVWNKGCTTKSLYQHRLIVALCDQIGFHYAQDFYWYTPAALPAPAEWVNVRRIRVKSAVDVECWLGKTDSPKARNELIFPDTVLPTLVSRAKAIQRILRDTC